uniref:Uncharacterized protein n=1 Tax=Triticum urartu TaxID=4572 RepID=A0A8R7UIK6_TRIUA
MAPPIAPPMPMLPPILTPVPVLKPTPPRSRPKSFRAMRPSDAKTSAASTTMPTEMVVICRIVAEPLRTRSCFYVIQICSATGLLSCLQGCASP